MRFAKAVFVVAAALAIEAIGVPSHLSSRIGKIMVREPGLERLKGRVGSNSSTDKPSQLGIRSAMSQVRRRSEGKGKGKSRSESGQPYRRRHHTLVYVEVREGRKAPRAPPPPVVPVSGSSVSKQSVKSRPPPKPQPQPQLVVVHAPTVVHVPTVVHAPIVVQAPRSSRSQKMRVDIPKGPTGADFNEGYNEGYARGHGLGFYYGLPQGRVPSTQGNLPF